MKKILQLTLEQLMQHPEKIVRLQAQAIFKDLERIKQMEDELTEKIKTR